VLHDALSPHKLRYLLYEQNIVERDAPRFAGLEGVMLQSKPAAADHPNRAGQAGRRRRSGRLRALPVGGAGRD